MVDMESLVLESTLHIVGVFCDFWLKRGTEIWVVDWRKLCLVGMVKGWRVLDREFAAIDEDTVEKLSKLVEYYEDREENGIFK